MNWKRESKHCRSGSPVRVNMQFTSQAIGNRFDTIPRRSLLGNGPSLLGLSYIGFKCAGWWWYFFILYTRSGTGLRVTIIAVLYSLVWKYFYVQCHCHSTQGQWSVKIIILSATSSVHFSCNIEFDLRLSNLHYSSLLLFQPSSGLLLPRSPLHRSGWQISSRTMTNGLMCDVKLDLCPL